MSSFSVFFFAVYVHHSNQVTHFFVITTSIRRVPLGLTYVWFPRQKHFDSDGYNVCYHRLACDKQVRSIFAETDSVSDRLFYTRKKYTYVLLFDTFRVKLIRKKTQLKCCFNNTFNVCSEEASH